MRTQHKWKSIQSLRPPKVLSVDFRILSKLQAHCKKLESCFFKRHHLFTPLPTRTHVFLWAYWATLFLVETECHKSHEQEKTYTKGQARAHCSITYSTLNSTIRASNKERESLICLQLGFALALYPTAETQPIPHWLHNCHSRQRATPNRLMPPLCFMQTWTII